ncbi:MAG TPA: diaminopimelate epimerase [Mycobacteriales bacterium]|nr:diaminopimelate epimerase [Mycobacteriales bacterium]
MRFAKGHGTGNDFVVLPDPDGTLDLTPERVRALCDRRRGIGGDGVLRVMRVMGSPLWFMDYRNADGSIAEMCGNGIRVYARYLLEQGWVKPGPLVVDTRSGKRALQLPEHGDITVDMGAPKVGEPPLRVTLAGTTYDATPVDMGNPHAVLAVPSVDAVAWDGVPLDVNVEVIERLGPQHLRMRVHERGVGETQSCGTGACAAVVAAAGWAHDDAPVRYDLDVPGGRLVVTWTGDTVLLAGPAVIVAEGETSL